MFDQIDGQDPVPTSVRVGPDGAVHVGLLALAAGPGAAKVVRIGDDGTPVDYTTGLTSVVGIDFDSAGNLYAAEVFGGDEGVGRLVKVTPEGEQSAIGEGQVVLPGGVPIGDDDSIHVSNSSILTGHPPAIPDAPPGARGQVLRFPAGS